MRIVLVTPHFPPRFRGGVEQHAQDLAGALANAGHQVTVVTVEAVDGPAEDVASDTSTADGYTVHRLRHRIDALLGTELSAYAAPAMCRWFSAFFADAPPDVVHVHSGYLIGIPALRAARAAGIPAIVTLHDHWYTCPRLTLVHGSGAACSGPESPGKCTWCLALGRRRARMLDDVTAGLAGRAWATAVDAWPSRSATHERQAAALDALGSAALVIAPSQTAVTLARRDGARFQRLEVVPIGVSITTTARTHARTAGVLRLAFLGTLHPHKGVHVAIAAVRSLPGLAVSLAVHGAGGDPGYEQSLEAAAAGDPRITFHGAYDRAALERILPGCDALVVPSLWPEVGPLVLREAFAAGLPVIGSDLGGIAEQVHDARGGRLFPPGDVPALAGLLRELVESPTEYDRLRRSIPPVARLADSLERISALYDDVLVSSASTGSTSR